MIAGLAFTGFRVDHPLPVAVLAAIALLAESQGVRLTASFELSVVALPVMFAAVRFGPLAAICVGTAALLVDLFRGAAAQRYLRWTIWSGSRVLVAGAAGIAAHFVGGESPTAFGTLVLAVTAAFAADVAGDLLLSPIPPVLRGTASWRALIKTLVPLQVSAIPLQVPVVALLAFSYVRLSPWSLVLFVIPAFAAHRLFLLYRQQRETAHELATANDRLERANLSFATALVATLDARDRYTAGHSAAVAIYARDIGSRMGLSDEDVRQVYVAGLVHDIGKIGLPPGLLEKPGALTLDERRQMEEHSAIGERILANVADYAEVAAIVRHHHERVDGNGYPDALVGDAIPIISRIIAVADAYNAMTSDRPYRDAMPTRVARLRLAQAVETQFDTSVVAAFEAILAGSGEPYRLAIGPEFVHARDDATAVAESAAA